jgi:hypothetical protein
MRAPISVASHFRRFKQQAQKILACCSSCSARPSRTFPRLPASASATAIVSLCTSSPIYVIAFATTRLLCMRLGARPSGATLDDLHAVRRVSPVEEAPRDLSPVRR